MKVAPGLGLRLRYLRLQGWPQRSLQFAELDAEAREESPLYQQALSLFQQGYRLNGWGDEAGFHTGATFLTRNGKRLKFWDPSFWAENRDDASFYQAAGLSCGSASQAGSNYWVLWHLDNLTEEERLAKEAEPG